jgi:glycosyltransferase involved in cell wall biosynthesis
VDKPLRILAVVNTPWDPRLGAARVWIELAEEWRRAGHLVEKFCLTDAYPKPAPSGAFAAIRLLFFPSLAAKFIRNNASRFDVVDALIGTVPFSKRSLGFSGLMVARSVGLYHLYEKFERMAATRWPDPPRGRIASRAFFRFFYSRARRTSDRSVHHCDLLNVPNSDEVTCVKDELQVTAPVISEPYGLSPERAQALREKAASAEHRLGKKKIAFIGMWSPRKGSKEWGRIVRDVRSRVPDASFVFLGTMIQNDAVWRDLESDPVDFVEIVPQFNPDELPQLLADCTVGVFPSYIEGFGMAIVEQLAARLPTVAYDVPGPRDILRDLPELLVPAGEIGALGNAICEILEADLPRYDELVRRSEEVSRGFSWPDIARNTIAEYRKHLNNVRG